MATKKTNTVKMSLTKALAEVKRIDAKIADLSNQVIAVAKKGNTDQIIGCNGLGTAKEFLSNTKGITQSLIDLNTRRIAIKTAIAKANVTTSVKINGEPFTIIAAIDAKNTNETLIQIYSKWLSQFAFVDTTIEEQEDIIQKLTQQSLQAALGSNQQSKSTLQTEIEKSTRLLYEGKLCSNYTREEIQKKLDAARDMLAEIDMCLSEVNSRTDIEVPM